MKNERLTLELVYHYNRDGTKKEIPHVHTLDSASISNDEKSPDVWIEFTAESGSYSLGVHPEGLIFLKGDNKSMLTLKDLDAMLEGYTPSSFKELETYLSGELKELNDEIEDLNDEIEREIRELDSNEL